MDIVLVCGYCGKKFVKAVPECYEKSGRKKIITCHCQEKKSHTNWTVEGQSPDIGWRKKNGEWGTYTRKKLKKNHKW
eukprot:scaffold148800_cov69-Cyclotella_meneghiniana.AAC.2